MIGKEIQIGPITRIISRCDVGSDKVLIVTTVEDLKLSVTGSTTDLKASVPVCIVNLTQNLKLSGNRWGTSNGVAMKFH